MDALIMKLADFGAIGVLAALLLYNTFYLQKKIIQIIENNTKAMTELKNFCSSQHVKKPYDT